MALAIATLTVLAPKNPLFGAQDPVNNTPVLGLETPQVGQVFQLPPAARTPFTATVEFETTQTLSDGSVVTHRSTSFVARDSKGRTRNELRSSMDAGTGLQPETLQVILYDPETKLRTTLSPRTRTAAQVYVSDLEAVTGPMPRAGGGTKSKRGATVEEVGIDYMNGLEVKHYRESRSDSDDETQTVYDYWYSQELKANLRTTRTDSRTGTLLTRLKDIQRTEPKNTLFEIPAGYRLLAAPKIPKKS